jgi:hypothetical protein
MLVADMLPRLVAAATLILVAGVGAASVPERPDAARVKTFWCGGESRREDQLYRGERPPAFIRVQTLPQSQGDRFRAFVYGGMHVLAPRNWGGCKGSGRGHATWISVAGGPILDLRQLSAVRGSSGTPSPMIACRAFADAKKFALKRGVSPDICFPLREGASRRATITRTKNLVTLADPAPGGDASRHFIWWFPETQKAAELRCFAPASQLGFCGAAFRDFDREVRTYAAR